jgi:prepilin signal peptidase PulO-like enzyme (type II secretory pathway)
MVLDHLPIAIAFGVVGWCLGWLSAWLSDWLIARDQLPRDARSLLVRDPFVQGGSALVWAAAPLLVPGDWIRWAETGLVAVPLIQVAVTDIRTRYVYTVVAAVGAVLGLAFGWHIHSTEVPWLFSLFGAIGGFVVFGALYLLGRLMYRGRGIEAMAWGDVTIATMVGAGAASCTPQALFLGVILGALIGIGVWVATRSRHSTMPYGPGLCLGGLAALFWC